MDERVAFLEGRVNEQSQMINGIRDALVGLEERMDRRFEGIEQRLSALDRKMDAGFAAMNQRMDAGVAAQDHRFAWLVGIQLTTTAAVVGTLLAALLPTVRKDFEPRQTAG